MKRIRLFGVITLLLFLAGCYGSRDLDQRAFVVAIAFDEAKEGEEGFILTAQLPVPSKMQPEGGGEGKSFETFSIEAQTVADGLTQLQREIDREIFIGHMRLILFSDGLAQKVGIERILDYFKRDFRVQRVTQLAVVQGKASEILKLQPPLEQSASAFIFNVLSEQSGSSLDIHTDFGKYLVLEADQGIEPVLPRVKKRGKAIVSGGAAVFHGGRMVGWLTPRETRGFSILVNEYSHGRFVVDSPNLPGEKISVRVRQASADRRVRLRGNRLFLDAEIQGGYETLEFTGPQGPGAELVGSLQKEVSRSVASEARAAIRKAQELKVDIFGYGRLVRGLYPDYWKKVRWDETFSQLQIGLRSNIKWTQTVRRPGR